MSKIVFISLSWIPNLQETCSFEVKIGKSVDVSPKLTVTISETLNAFISLTLIMSLETSTLELALNCWNFHGTKNIMFWNLKYQLPTDPEMVFHMKPSICGSISWTYTMLIFINWTVLFNDLCTRRFHTISVPLFKMLVFKSSLFAFSPYPIINHPKLHLKPFTETPRPRNKTTSIISEVQSSSSHRS